MPRVCFFRSGVLRRLANGLIVVTWLGAAGHAPPASAEELRDRLQDLSRQHAFTIDGLDRVGSEEAQQPADGDLSTQLRELLRNYNHLMVSGRGSAVEKLVILGIKRGSPGVPPDPAVSLTRDGPHHRVQAVLSGPNGRPVTVSLILDTGASNIVLPESMIATLGFRAETLQSSLSQTASGMLPVKMGLLKAVTVGQNRAADVAVSFVEDRKLGALHLLGMSYLSRFRFTIDDEKSELILMAR